MKFLTIYPLIVSIFYILYHLLNLGIMTFQNLKREPEDIQKYKTTTIDKTFILLTLSYIITFIFL
jgi:hypothetical protein